MSWRVNAEGNVFDPYSATDADMDMAYALLVVGKNDEATTLINKIFEHEVEKDTFVLKPGDGWGGSESTSPSYFSPAYFDIFSRVTNNPNWNYVAAKSREIIDKVQEKMGGLETGLVPDWCTAEGEAVVGLNNTYSYNACRFPWRQAMVFEWE
jgi:endo-1,4-beta-D-glucanase Y